MACLHNEGRPCWKQEGLTEVSEHEHDDGADQEPPEHSYRLPVRGLEHHRSTADDRVQLDPQGSRQASERWNVLEALARHRRDALFRIPWRDLLAPGVARLHWWCARLVLHSVRDLRW